MRKLVAQRRCAGEKAWVIAGWVAAMVDKHPEAIINAEFGELEVWADEREGRQLGWDE